LLGAAVAHDEHLTRAELRQLGGLRLSADEIDDRHLLDRGCQILVVGRDVEVAVDKVFVLITVERDRAAVTFPVGENEVDPLGGRESVNAGTGNQRGRGDESSNHVSPPLNEWRNAPLVFQSKGWSTQPRSTALLLLEA